MKVHLGRVRLGSIRNKNNWNNANKRLFGSYSHSGIPGFPFRLFYSQEQNSRNVFRNIFRNKFLFRNIPNERALEVLAMAKIHSVGNHFPPKNHVLLPNFFSSSNLFFIKLFLANTRKKIGGQRARLGEKENLFRYRA